MALSIRVHAADRLAEERKAPNDDQLRLGTAEGHVHAPPVRRNPSAPTPSSGVVSDHRENHDIGFAALERVHRAHECAIAAYGRELLEMRGREP